MELASRGIGSDNSNASNANAGGRNGTDRTSNRSNRNNRFNRSRGGRSNQSGRGGRSNGEGRYTWQQYTKYCFSWGVNLHCNGTECNKYGCNKKDNHDPNYSYADRKAKGGSRWMEGRWMKWLNPRNQLSAEHGGEPTSK